jgi:hypothetical protein
MLLFLAIHLRPSLYLCLFAVFRYLGCSCWTTGGAAVPLATIVSSTAADAASGSSKVMNNMAEYTYMTKSFWKVLVVFVFKHQK